MVACPKCGEINERDKPGAIKVGVAGKEKNVCKCGHRWDVDDQEAAIESWQLTFLKSPNRLMTLNQDLRRKKICERIESKLQ